MVPREFPADLWRRLPAEKVGPVHKDDGPRFDPPAARPRRWLAIVSSSLAIPYLLIVVLMMIYEESMIFFPDKHPAGFWRTDALSYKIEDASFAAADGVQLHGWYVPCEAPRAFVLFSHGNGGNLTHRKEMLARLHGLRLAVLIYDYRGYGRSEGAPDEPGILADARAARRWLAERAGVPETEIVHLGESLGGGVAVDLAANDGARGLILLSTFTSLPDVAAIHYPLLPVRLLMRSQLDSVSKIGRYPGPTLVAHGDVDTLVPQELGRRLYEAATGQKRFVNLPGSDHNEDPPEFYQAVDAFIEALPS